MPNHLLLIRHAQSQRDPARPASQWQLSEAGRHSSVALAAQLAPYRPAVIVTSRERKAIETGALLAAQLQLPTELAEGLHEHEREHVAYQSDEDFMRSVAAFFAQPDVLVFGEETAPQATARFEQAVQRVIAAQPGCDVAIVAHGTVITLFVAQHTGIAPLPFWQNLKMPDLVVLPLPE